MVLLLCVSFFKRHREKVTKDKDEFSSIVQSGIMSTINIEDTNNRSFNGFNNL